MTKMRRAGFIAAVVAGLTVLSACGDDPSPEEAFVDDYCDSLKPCCPASKPDQGSPGSGCKPFYSQFGGSGYDQAKGDACLGEIRAHLAEANFCQRVSQLAPTCRKVFSPNSGTKQPGESCEIDRDCAASSEGEARCRPQKSGGGDRCVLEIAGKEGDTPCLGTGIGSTTNYSDGAEATRGFVCNLRSGVWCNKSKGCERTKAIGEACTTGTSVYECGESAVCFPNKCVAKAPPGSSSSAIDPSLLIVCSTTED